MDTHFTDASIKTDAAKGAAIVREALFRGGYTDPPLGVVLGTGWGKAIGEGDHHIPLKELPGFEGLGELSGHDRHLLVTTIDGRRVVALRGRVHQNEHPTDPRVMGMVRLQMHLLHALGVRQTVLTSAVGSLDDDLIQKGDIVFVREFMTAFGGVVPALGGEFEGPSELIDVAAIKAIIRKTGRDGIHMGIHCFQHGPYFEGPATKRFLALSGSHVVGMSSFPEVCAVMELSKKPETRMSIVPVTCVSNDMFTKHAHEGNVATLNDRSPYLGSILIDIIRELASRS